MYLYTQQSFERFTPLSRSTVMTFISTKLHLSNTEMFFLVHLDVYNEISQIFNRLENSKENYLERHPATVSGHK